MNAEIVGPIDSSDEWIQERSGIISRRFAAHDESVVDMAEHAARARARARPGSTRRRSARSSSRRSPTPTRPRPRPPSSPTGSASSAPPSTSRRGLRRLLLRHLGGQRHGPRRQRRVRPGRRRREAVRLHRLQRPRHARSSSATARARRSSARPTRPASARRSGARTARSGGHLPARVLDRRPTSEADGAPIEQSGPPSAWPASRSSAGPSGAWPRSRSRPSTRPGITIDDLDAFIPHQANMRIIDAMIKQLKLPADIPVARDIAADGQHLRRLGPAGHRADAARGRDPQRRPGPPDRLRRRPGLCRPGRRPALASQAATSQSAPLRDGAEPELGAGRTPYPAPSTTPPAQHNHHIKESTTWRRASRRSSRVWPRSSTRRPASTPTRSSWTSPSPTTSTSTPCR